MSSSLYRMSMTTYLSHLLCVSKAWTREAKTQPVSASRLSSHIDLWARRVAVCDNSESFNIHKVFSWQTMWTPFERNRRNLSAPDASMLRCFAPSHFHFSILYSFSIVQFLLSGRAACASQLLDGSVVFQSVLETFCGTGFIYADCKIDNFQQNLRGTSSLY